MIEGYDDEPVKKRIPGYKNTPGFEFSVADTIFHISKGAATHNFGLQEYQMALDALPKLLLSKDVLITIGHSHLDEVPSLIRIIKNTLMFASDFDVGDSIFEEFPYEEFIKIIIDPRYVGRASDFFDILALANPFPDRTLYLFTSSLPLVIASMCNEYPMDAILMGSIAHFLMTLFNQFSGAVGSFITDDSCYFIYTAMCSCIFSSNNKSSIGELIALIKQNHNVDVESAIHECFSSINEKLWKAGCCLLCTCETFPNVAPQVCSILRKEGVHLNFALKALTHCGDAWKEFIDVSTIQFLILMLKDSSFERSALIIECLSQIYQPGLSVEMDLECLDRVLMRMSDSSIVFEANSLLSRILNSYITSNVSLVPFYEVISKYVQDLAEQKQFSHSDGLDSLSTTRQLVSSFIELCYSKLSLTGGF